MDSDPEDSNIIPVEVVDFRKGQWAVTGIQQKKEA
jgi:hypothetical protein